MSYEPSHQPYAPPSSSLALVSLISGILGLSLFPLIGSIIAIITGPMAKKEIYESGGALGGEGLANAGTILGWIGIALGVVGCCVAGAFMVLPLCFIPLAEGNFWLLPTLLLP